ncbi:MAG: NAD-dependent epimerase/dehydratase family protein [Phycisphaerales bacterium]|nr:NAD-dependent epimerase/dehydratase family protein [Phycisphaerales bacterium]
MAADVFKVDSIKDVAQLEDMLSTPTQGAIDSVGKAKGDWMVLGVGGKIGPSLAHMVKRCVDASGSRAKVFGVDKIYSPAMEKELKGWGIETLTCDMLNRDALEKLPDAKNVIFMAGMKFGSTGNEALTWAMNAYLPAIVAQRFKSARITAFSTGNVYGLQDITMGGPQEDQPLNPVGDYAMSCMGRERMFQHFAIANKTPITLLRLNYATEMRYGVLVDICQTIMADQPLDVSMSMFNVIWQADACAMTIRSLDLAGSPATPFNVAGPEFMPLRRVAEKFGKLLGKKVNLIGQEASNALLNNGQYGHRIFGYPRVSIEQLIHWTADWVKRGGASHGKPTHYESRDGKF